MTNAQTNKFSEFYITTKRVDKKLYFKIHYDITTAENRNFIDEIDFLSYEELNENIDSNI
jgi:hypothetical protein